MSGIARSVRASLLRAAALVSIAVLGALGAGAADSHHHGPRLRYGRLHDHPDVLVLVWKGKMGRGMAQQFREAFEKNKADTRGVLLRLDSGGGSVKEGERVIEVLQEIKRTHKLVTSVAAGKRCGSMCVFLFVQGDKRVAAPASLWLFHEVSRSDKSGKHIIALDRDQWLGLVDRYWVPAGVSPEWIARVKAHAVTTDVWESGSDLLRDGSNLIYRPLSDEHHRKVVPTAAVR